MSNKIIFLDIDGVLNSSDNLYSLTKLRRINSSNNDIAFKDNANIKTRDEYGQLFDERCVNWLKFIIETTGADICISSTWRYAGLQNIKNLFKHRNIMCNIVGVTPYDNYKISHDLFKKYDFKRDRGLEIHQWLMDNSKIETINQYPDFHTETCVYDKYCIIDDDMDMKQDQFTNFVQTSNKYGIDAQSSNMVINILNDCENKYVYTKI